MYFTVRFTSIKIIEKECAFMLKCFYRLLLKVTIEASLCQRREEKGEWGEKREGRKGRGKRKD